MNQVLEKNLTELKHKQIDPWALGYHIQSKSGWINDPNGLCFHKGRYHVFFQHHPHTPKWGPMHWGHVSSTDLIHWEHHPIALTPGDEGMCFSGSAVSVGDELALIYTGHKWLKEDHNDDYMVQHQCLATSKDGVNFQKKGIVIASAYNSEIVHFRDPKVWNENNAWHMVVGVKENDQGKVAYYRSDNLEQWEFINILGTADAKRDEGYMWECPDFFKLGDKHILICSPQGMSSNQYERRNLFQNGYFVGQFNVVNGEFSRGNFKELDYGHDFYACQTFLDDEGRRIAIAWMDMWESAMPEQAFGRAGALTIPRELTIDKLGHIYQKPVAELKKLRKKLLLLENKKTYQQGKTKEKIEGIHLEINLSIQLPSDMNKTNEEKVNSFERSGILLRCGNGQHTYVGYDAMQQRVFVDRNHSGAGVSGIRYTPQINTKNLDTLTFQIFIDSSSIEVFVNNGQFTLSSRIYPNLNSQGIEFISENGITNILDLSIYELECTTT
ncbi:MULTISPECIES: glycoside hydrolase family 32 protein [Vibrio]|uniref:Sucrose-6-phosphate hydrolase n=1 Tax=Vibrio rumoiensis TaxID=76258 RepID=A0ABW7J0G8_9VIBR|nr:sucrose-6-phosphate hydrolase [Vibrio litoralis]